MKRRRFISVAGCALFGSIAGCIDRQEVTSFGERVNEQVASFTVQDFTIQQSIAYRGSVHPRIRNDEDTQYLIFGVDVEQDVENRAIYDRFTLSTDGSINEELQVVRIPTDNQGELQQDMYLMYEASREASIIDERLKFSGLN